MRAGLRLFVFLALLFSFGPLTASARQPTAAESVNPLGGAPVGSSFEIDNRTYDLTNPSVAYDSAHDAYWVAHQSGDNQAILLTILLNKNGGRYWTTLALPLGQTVKNPDLAYNSATGKMLVVWEQDDGSRSRIKGRLLSLDDMSGAEFELGTGAALRNRFTPAVAYASTGDKFLVVWESVVWQSGTSDIEAQIVTSGGALEGSNFLVAIGDSQFAHDEPDLAYNRSRNEYLVAWVQEEKANAQKDIFARRVTANGVILDGTAITIGYHTANETAPAVGAIPTSPNFGVYMVVWELAYSATDDDIYTRLVSGLGVSGAVRILAATGDRETDPAIAGSEYRDHYLVTWSAPYPGFINHGIYGRPVAINGDIVESQQVVGGLFAVNSSVAAAGPDGDFLVAFQDPNLLVPVTYDLWGRYWGNWLYLPLLR